MNHLKNAARLSSLLILSFLATSQAQADVIIGNMPGDANATFWTGVGRLSATGTSTVKAVGFTVASTSFRLDSVRLTLGSSDGTTVSGVSLTLHVDAAGSPGSTLLGFGAPSPAIATGVGDYVFLPGTSFNLQAGAKYWLVLNSTTVLVNPTVDQFSWRGRSPQVTATGPGAIYASASISSDGGSTWNSSGTQNAFEVDGTVVAATVPAVSDWALAILAVLLICTAAAILSSERRHGFRRAD